MEYEDESESFFSQSRMNVNEMNNFYFPVIINAPNAGSRGGEPLAGILKGQSPLSRRRQ